jgi:short-subunit dehydrogenase
MTFDYSSQTVLITGASSGIGKSFATALAGRGSSLVLVARRLDRLTALAAELTQAHGISVDVISADLTSPNAAAELRAITQERGITVTSLINNAGFGTFGTFIEEDLARVRQEIAVDITAPVSLSHVFLPYLRRKGDGFLINVASMAAYTPAPRMAVYAAAKAFVLSFTEALWAELRGSGVTVFALSPGATSTEFNAVVGTEDATAGAKMRTPDDVVATALKHLERSNPGPSVIDGAANRIGATIGRLPSRRISVTMMNRLTDPARRKK